MKLINKTLLGAATLMLAGSAFAGLPTFSQIVTHNNTTDGASAVKINGTCTGHYKDPLHGNKEDLWTAPGQTLKTAAIGVAALCQANFPCSFSVYTGDETNARNCAASTLTGSGSIDSAGNINLTPATEAKYTVNASVPAAGIVNVTLTNK